jgi:hypothetical protein
MVLTTTYQQITCQQRNVGKCFSFRECAQEKHPFSRHLLQSPLSYWGLAGEQDQSLGLDGLQEGGLLVVPEATLPAGTDTCLDVFGWES